MDNETRHIMTEGWIQNSEVSFRTES